MDASSTNKPSDHGRSLLTTGDETRQPSEGNRPTDRAESLAAPATRIRHAIFRVLTSDNPAYADKQI
jgi:hypothetical protein